MIWRLAAASRFPRNARVQHLPTSYGSKRPKCSSHGEYLQIHFSYADELGLKKCPGCFDGIGLHDNTSSKWSDKVTINGP